MYVDLSKTSIITFEIGVGCNLSKIHSACPINTREYDEQFGPLTVDKIIASIEDAQKLNFDGYFGFHHYNEPLMYLSRILEVIEGKPDAKYLLWSNGLLLSRDIRKNEFLNKFEKVMITQYFEKDRNFFAQLCEMYPNIHILKGDLDDRLDAYERDWYNEVGCKRVFFEMPIDHYGNVQLCTLDWNNSHKIGNINDTSFKDVVLSEAYQTLLRNASQQKLLDRHSCPEVCKNCNSPWFTYKKMELHE